MKESRNLSGNMFSMLGSCVYTNSFRNENKIADHKDNFTNCNYNYCEFITDQQEQRYKDFRDGIKLKTQNKQQMW